MLLPALTLHYHHHIHLISLTHTYTCPHHLTILREVHLPGGFNVWAAVAVLHQNTAGVFSLYSRPRRQPCSSRNWTAGNCGGSLMERRETYSIYRSFVISLVLFLSYLSWLSLSVSVVSFVFHKTHITHPKQHTGTHREIYYFSWILRFVCDLSPVLKLLKMATGMRALLDTVVQALPQVRVITHTRIHISSLSLSQGHTGVN